MAARPSRSAKIRVLLAGEQQLLRAGLRLLVEEQPDFEAFEAAGAEQAVAAHQQCDADVVLLDFEPNSGPGREALAALVARGVKVVAMTANDEPELMLRAIRSGARAAVPHSASEYSLLEAARAVNQGLRWLTADLERYCRHQLTSTADASTEPEEPDAQSDWERLTARESQVARLVGEGLKHSQIAERLGISGHTVKNHLRHIFLKLDIRSRVELAVYAHSGDLG